MFWTSLDINAKGEKAITAGTKIPILIQRGDGKYYVSQIKGCQQEWKIYGDSGSSSPQQIIVNIINAGKEYDNLSAAYSAYQDALNSDEYKNLPK